MYVDSKEHLVYLIAHVSPPLVHVWSYINVEGGGNITQSEMVVGKHISLIVLLLLHFYCS